MGRDGSQCVVAMHVLGGGGWVGRDGSVCCYNACVGRWRVGGERWVSVLLQCMCWGSGFSSPSPFSELLVSFDYKITVLYLVQLVS